MRSFLKISLLFSAVFASLNLSAQQLPIFRNSFFNNYALNPSSISNPTIPDIILDHRSQWIGFEGAPRMSTLALRYMFMPQMGIGAFVMSDTHGISKKLDLNLSYSYVLRTDAFNISFGLAWTVSQYKIAGTRIKIFDVNDNLVNSTIDDMSWKPDANAGIMLLSEKFYLGFSIMQLFQTKYMFFGADDDIPGLIKDKRHYFLTGAYQLKLNKDDNILQPSTNIYYAYGTPVKLDIGLTYLYQNKFQTALVYSTGDAISFLFGYRYNRYYLSYAFDISLNKIRNVSSGSHEICIGIYLFDKTETKSDSSPMF